MNIQKATKKAIAQGRGMTRPGFPNKCWLLPTNTPERVIIFKDREKLSKCWNPNAEDLIADDWIIK
ncbi:hypothetical protein JOC36_000846 [Weissella uvarum]|uniref:Thoeris anti-defense Tad2 family protein n=1 Tax=Bacilli TaxID=91061 RepID=UPI0019600825|nr:MULTISPECIES: DUF2829 domain-containing protein [Bacilli]MBM7617297.1 hypothetical protein [Weissella uvarum]MCM0595202.1 DUF2829 domain-containing protein [Weissella uvarum]MCM0601487.1 DUF2829 domain-containing protein [Periweissella ghanensis]MDA5653779.1 aspartate ammonia-lyase [Staphylococcus aureus]